jgi:hypothetical protein
MKVLKVIAPILICTSTTIYAQTEIEQLLSYDGRLENIIEVDDGTLYFTVTEDSEVLKLLPSGQVEVFTDYINFPQGILEYNGGFVIDSQDREPAFFSAGPADEFQSGPPQGPDPEGPPVGLSLAGLGARLTIVDGDGKALKTIQGPDEDAFYNGIATLSEHSVLIADPGGDRLLIADLEEGSMNVWLSSEDMSKVIGPSPGGPANPNGLKILNGWVYFTRANIYKIRIGPNNEPMGDPILAADIGMTDDFAITDDGVIYASSGNNIISVTSDGTASIFVEGACGGCTAARVSKDKKSLFFVGGGMSFMPNPPPGHISKKPLPDI